MKLVGPALAIVVAIGVASPAPAATPEVAAAQQLSAAEQAARTTFRAALTAAQLQVNAALGDVELAVTGAASPLEAGDELFAALEAFQRAVFVAENLASNARAEAAKAALATLGANLGGIYPEAFYPGLGTPRERFEAAIAKDTAKAYAKLAKRLGKVIARFAAQGFALNVRLRTPTYTASRTWSETTVDFVLALPPTVDLVVVWSDLATLGDGQLRASGSGLPAHGPGRDRADRCGGPRAPRGGRRHRSAGRAGRRPVVDRSRRRRARRRRVRGGCEPGSHAGRRLRDRLAMRRRT